MSRAQVPHKDVLMSQARRKRAERHAQERETRMSSGLAHQGWVQHVRMRNFGEVAERFKAAVLKTVDPQGSGGSNPSLSAIFNPGDLLFRSPGLKTVDGGFESPGREGARHS
jgi:hypothetical protein